MTICDRNRSDIGFRFPLLTMKNPKWLFLRQAPRFRHSFDDILLNIEEGEHPVHQLLRNFFRSHKIATWHFKYYLIGKTRQRFEKAWQNYQSFYDQHYQKGAALAQFASPKTAEEIQKLDELRKHIETLLGFTM
jgi:hypothetical protein